MSQPNQVLFDELGPRGRRRIALLTAVAAVLIAGAVVAAVLRLADQGQFDGDLWRPLVDPTTEEFPQVWERLGNGLVVTLVVALVAMVAALLIGVVIAVARLTLGRAGRVPLIGVVELLRGLPVIVTILFVSVLLPVIGLDLDDNVYLAIGLVLYNCVIFSEIVRAGVVSVPRGQVEAAKAIGLTRSQVMRAVELPQAFRSMLPAIVSQLVVILKDTALGAVVLNGVTDLARQSRQLRIPLDNPLQLFVVTALIYIAINLVLTQAAQRLERRLGRSRGAAKRNAEQEEERAPLQDV